MAFLIQGSVTITRVPPGAGPMSVPSSQSMSIANGVGINGGLVSVGGGDTPAASDFITAIQTLATNLGNALTAAQIAALQAWSTGGQ